MESASSEVSGGARVVRAVVVDDSPLFLKALSMFVQRQAGIQLVGSAMDGHRAVRRVLELEPDLVLMDLKLPGMNGLQATRCIKARANPPVVIMVTAEDTQECRAAASEAGTDAFVGKMNIFPHLREAIVKLFPTVTSANNTIPQRA